MNKSYEQARKYFYMQQTSLKVKQRVIEQDQQWNRQNYFDHLLALLPITARNPSRRSFVIRKGVHTISSDGTHYFDKKKVGAYIVEIDVMGVITELDCNNKNFTRTFTEYPADEQQAILLHLQDWYDQLNKPTDKP